MSARILIVEDHDLLAQSLTLALQADGFDVERAGELTPQGVRKAAEALHADVVLLDLHLGVAGSALPLVPELRDLGASVVMVTGETNRARLGECVEAGALGIVQKSAPFDHLVDTIREVAEMRTILPKPERDELLAEMRRQHAEEEARLAVFDRLTARERDVLAGLCDGKSAQTIASEAVVSLATVRTQVHALLQKLGVNSQLAAVALARRAEWEAE